MLSPVIASYSAALSGMLDDLDPHHCRFAHTWHQCVDPSTLTAREGEFFVMVKWPSRYSSPGHAGAAPQRPRRAPGDPRRASAAATALARRAPQSQSDVDIQLVPHLPSRPPPEWLHRAVPKARPKRQQPPPRRQPRPPATPPPPSLLRAPPAPPLQPRAPPPSHPPCDQDADTDASSFEDVTDAASSSWQPPSKAPPLTRTQHRRMLHKKAGSPVGAM